MTADLIRKKNRNSVAAENARSNKLYDNYSLARLTFIQCHIKVHVQCISLQMLRNMRERK